MPSQSRKDGHSGGRSRSKKRQPTNGPELPTGGPQPGTTGRYIVLLREDAVEQGVRALESSAGVRIEDLTGIETAAELETEEAPEGALSNIGVAVISLDPDQLQSVGAASLDATSAILAVEAERVVYALDSTLVQPPVIDTLGEEETPVGLSVEYVTGYRDSVDHLLSRIGATRRVTQSRSRRRGLSPGDESQFTWGLQVTGVAGSKLNGRGTRVAVLDTGFGPHPDP